MRNIWIPLLFITLLILLLISTVFNFASYALVKKTLLCSEATELLELFNTASTPIFAIFGLVIGFLYFRSRYQFDSLNIERDKKNNKLQILIQQFKEADDLVLQVLNLNGIGNNSNLGLVREKIIRSFDHIEMFLESNLTIIGFSHPEMFLLLKVNSIVDKNDNLMRNDFSSLTIDSFNDVRDKYRSSISNALRTCYSKFE